ncbi:MAG: DUF790 family protein [Myxococcota bacterium]
MLTADLVDARRVRKELHLIPLDAARRARAVELAEVFLQIAREHVGRTRDELEDALGSLEVLPNEKRMADGLCKLIGDRCEFDAPEDLDPTDIRRQLFLLGAEARRNLAWNTPFDRAALLQEIATQREMSTTELERALYADLKGAHLLRSVPAITATDLVARYDDAQAQGVLLRAVRMTVEVRCASPTGYRHLFRRMKFLRLLATVDSLRGGGYRLEIDGPFSMFESTTRYGLSLAMLLPDLKACDAFELEAEVKWGKERQSLTFRMKGGCPDLRVEEDDPYAHLPDEVQALAQRVRGMDTPFEVQPNADILNLPGVGVCVPDLVFIHKQSGECVYLEVMGFWSRQAVWKRVELVEKGLPQRIVFAVSERLRVSEKVMGEELPGALYVYKGMMNALSVLERVERLVAGTDAGGTRAGT